DLLDDARLFFSSSRRHTSFSRDWSSDVCASDLALPQGDVIVGQHEGERQHVPLKNLFAFFIKGFELTTQLLVGRVQQVRSHLTRSEERRVGEGCRLGEARRHRRRQRWGGRLNVV